MGRSNEKVRPKVRLSLEATLAAVLAHPVRVRCFICLTERIASATQLMRAFGFKDVSYVNYHLEKLEELDMIEEVGWRPVRGGTERFYRACRRAMIDDDGARELTLGEREALSRHIVNLSIMDAALALDTGTFDNRVDRCLIRMPMLVDEEGYGEMNALEAEHLDRRMEIQAKSAERLAQRRRGGEEELGEIPINSVTMFFEAAEGSGQLRNFPEPKPEELRPPESD
jgi:DNA-binding transcriptional ArsR family regulator